MMRLLLLLITLGSLAFSAAILPRDDAPVSPNVTVVEEDPDTVYTQETKPGMVQFFSKRAYHGDYTWFMDEQELNTHWRDIAICRTIDKKFSSSIAMHPRMNGLIWGCMVYATKNCKGESYWYQQSRSQLWTTGWDDKIQSVKCWMDGVALHPPKE